MAHKTLIDGTAHEISGGKVLVDGTAYSISKGKTLIDGTAHEIAFGTTWQKYNCSVSSYYDYAYVQDNAQVGTQLGPYDTSSLDGGAYYNNYYFDSTSGFYGPSSSNYPYFADYPYEGYYSISSTAVYVLQEWSSYKKRLLVCVASASYQAVGGPYTTISVGSYIGTVEAAAGARPDADKGYTYYTTYNGYTIMRNGSTYYAYKQV